MKKSLSRFSWRTKWPGVRCFLLFFGCLNGIQSASAQLQMPGYDIRRISLQNSLESQEITSLVKDQNNMIWFGTLEGLYCFDGFQNIRIDTLKDNNDSHDAHYFTDLAIDACLDGVIFACTKKGAKIVDLATHTYLLPSSMGIPDTIFRGFIQIEPGAGGVFYGLKDHTIYIIRKTSAKQYNCKPWYEVPAGPIYGRMVADPTYPDVVWLLSKIQKVWRVSPLGIQEFILAGKNELKPSDYPYNLTFTSQGIYCWDMHNRVWEFSQQTNEFLEVETGVDLYDLIPDLAAVGVVMKHRELLFCDISLDINQHALGTNLGLFLVRKKITGFHNFEPLQELEVRGIKTEPNGRWAVGTYSGFYTGRFGDNKVTKLPHLKIVWDFLPLDKHLWLLGLENYCGIQLWDPVKNTIVDSTFINQFPNREDFNSILVFTKDMFGTIWAGTTKLLLFSPPGSPLAFRRYTDPEESLPFLHNNIRTILSSKDTCLWIGADEGLFCLRYNATYKQYQLVQSNSFTGKVMISHLYEDHLGNIWIASKGRGLGCLNHSTKQIIWYGTEAGLCNINACRIESTNDDSVLWISTHSGLSRFDVNARVFHNFNDENGFPGNEFNSAASTRRNDGVLFFGGIYGLIYFHPDSIIVANYDYKTMVPYVQVYDKKAETFSVLNQLSTGLNLGAYPELVEFVLGSNELIYPEKIRYRYRLIGLSDQWNFITGDNKVKYVRLPPGKYEFQAQAIPLNGHLGTIFSITVQIAMPIYETWWFRVLAFISLIMLGYGVYWYRLQQIMKKYQIRQQVADDLHDDIGNKLNIISIIAQKVTRFARKNNLQPPSDQSLEKLLELSRDTQISLTTMIWSVDPTKDLLENLITRMQDFADDFVRPVLPNFSFSAPVVIPEIKLNLRVRHHLLLIYQELLVNIIKHTHSTQLNVSFRLDGDNIIVTLINHHQPELNQPFTTISNNRGQSTLNRRLLEINGTIEFLEIDTNIQKTIVLVPQVFK